MAISPVAIGLNDPEGVIFASWANAESDGEKIVDAAMAILSGTLGELPPTVATQMREEVASDVTFAVANRLSASEFLGSLRRQAAGSLK